MKRFRWLPALLLLALFAPPRAGAQIYNQVNFPTPCTASWVTYSGGMNIFKCSVGLTFDPVNGLAITASGSNIFSVTDGSNALYFPNGTGDLAFVGEANDGPALLITDPGDVTGYSAVTLMAGTSNANAGQFLCSESAYGLVNFLNDGPTTGGCLFNEANNLPLVLATNSNAQFVVSGAGGLYSWGVTGGDKGMGTINVAGCYVNNVACATGSSSGANPSATIGLSAVNGSATTFLRSDGAPALSQAIVPTWTGVHTFTPSANSPAIIVDAHSSKYGIVINGNSTTNDSLGLMIAAGTSASDNALQINSFAGSQMLQLNGVGGLTLNGNATFNSVSIGAGTLSVGEAGSWGGYELEDGQTGNGVWQLLSGYCGIPSAGVFGIYTNFGDLSPFCINSSGGIFMPDIASSSSAQSGTLCWGAAGLITYDPSLGCLTSSRRFKEHIAGLSGALSELMRLQPVGFSYKASYDHFHLGPQVGLIAEDVAAVDPRLVGYEADGKTVRGVRYAQSVALVIAAVQAQQREIRALWAALALTFLLALTAHMRAHWATQPRRGEP